MLKLVVPTPACKEQVLDYKREFAEINEHTAGTAALDSAETFESWYQALQDNSSEETVRPGLVPESLFLAVDQNDYLVGMIDIRHRLNDYLAQFGGHIGYSVRKSERQKGYATEMLALALEEAKKLGLRRVLITCDRDNLGSAKTILNNGGVLENEAFDPNDNTITQRYWIEL